MTADEAAVAVIDALDRAAIPFMIVGSLASNVPLEPGLEEGWKTLLVANVAEASSRQDGRVFELRQADGRPIESAAEAAAFAEGAGVV